MNMKRKALLFGFGLVVAGLAIHGGFAAPTPEKEETVTLTVTGMN